MSRWVMMVDSTTWGRAWEEESVVDTDNQLDKVHSHMDSSHKDDGEKLVRYTLTMMSAMILLEEVVLLQSL